ncbi:MAG: nucleotidyltransferase domain-containing protein [Chloroflexota bacterium]
MDRLPFSTEQLNQLQKTCANESQILAVFLFGSYVDGYATPRSDIDLAILLSASMTLPERLALEVSFCEVLGREDLDIIVLNDASISLRFRAISGHLLYERTPDRVSDFIQRTMLDYYDFQHILKTYQREFAASLEQDYGL